MNNFLFGLFFAFVLLVGVVGAVLNGVGMSEWCKTKHPELSQLACFAAYGNRGIQRIEFDSPEEE